MPRKTRTSRATWPCTGTGFNEAAARCRGKRPAGGTCRGPGSCFNEAAARCRGKRPPGFQGRRLPPRASMRPRPDAAENGRLRSRAGGAGSGASMRPRPDAAENCSPPCPCPRPPTACFNEAAARCRGKHAPPALVRTAAERGFNEAAARCRGKRPDPACAAVGAGLASMRPRPDAAENGGGMAF